MEDKENLSSRFFSSQVPISTLNISRELIEKALGYKPGKAPGFIEEDMKNLLGDLGGFDDLRCGYALILAEPLVVREMGFSVGQITFNSGKVIAANLEGSEYLAIILATAGEKIGRKILEANQEKDYMRAYLYDTAGSEIVEAACDYIQNMVEKKANALGFGITNRYSPGYCGWSVAEQQQLFSLLPEKFCGISLTASSLMLPLKSVSAVIGIGKKATRRAYGCAICTLKQCYKRKLKNES